MSDKLAEVIAAHRRQHMRYGNGEDYFHRALNPVDAVNIDLDRDGGVVGVELLTLPNLEVTE